MTLADVRRVVVPGVCAKAVETHLRSVGVKGYEGMALWVGRQDGATFHVLETIVPTQRHISNDDGVCVIVEGDALHRLNVRFYKEGLTLLGQIHSHPGRAYHSSTDDAYAIATTVGCLSLVVPDFARDRFEIARCASYRLDGQGRWRSLTARAAAALIEIRN